MTLGEKLCMLRQTRGWTQKELAQRAHVHPSLLSELETGRRRDASGSHLRRLARALYVSVDYLTGLDYDAPP